MYWTKFECISGRIRRILTNDLCASARGAPVSAFCGNSVVRSHFASTSHWPLASLTMPARRCFVFARWLRGGASGSYLCLPHPSSARTSPSASADGSLIIIRRNQCHFLLRSSIQENIPLSIKITKTHKIKINENTKLSHP